MTTAPPTEQELLPRKLFSPETFGRRIVDALNTGRLSYRNAEVVVGVDHATLHRVASAAMIPSVETYLRIERWLSTQPSQDSGWRPISEAPRDGTAILVFASGTSSRWDGDLGDLICCCAWHPDAGFCVCELREPSHWRPLPAPPSGRNPVELAADPALLSTQPSRPQGEEDLRSEAAREAFRAGWYVNAAVGEQQAEYLANCESADWLEHLAGRDFNLPVAPDTLSIGRRTTKKLSDYVASALHQGEQEA